MKPYRIAFFPLVRVQFDVPLAEEKISQARKSLADAGFELIGPEKPISDLDSARAAALAVSNQPFDLALVFQATFADSTMAVSLAEILDTPLFLWAIPEEWTGGRLRLNSLCGINLAGHALTLRQRRFNYAYAEPTDAATVTRIRTLSAAGALDRTLKSACLGVVGESPAGMDSCILDEANLAQVFGVKIEKIDLQEVFNRARAIPHAETAQTQSRLATIAGNLGDLEQAPLHKTLNAYAVLKQMVREKQLSGLAVRCWPEFFTQYGSAACGALSLLSGGFDGDTPIPCSCEADINGTVTQFILQTLAGDSAFGTDMVGADFEKNTVALWHCGMAPINMADPSHPIAGGIHSNRKVPLIMDFRLKPGQVTVLRVSQSGGRLRMILGTGEILPHPKPFSGSSGTIRFSCSAREFVDLLMREGLEHHISLVYGNFCAEIEAFASLANIPVTRF